MKICRIPTALLLFSVACLGQTTPSVGSGAPTDAIRQRFYLAYLRNGFNLLVSLPPLGNVRQFGSGGLIQEFQDAKKDARLALVKDLSYTPPPAEVDAPIVDVFQVLAEMYAYYSNLNVNTVGYPRMDTSACPPLADNSCQYQIFSKNYALFVFKTALLEGSNVSVRDPFFTKWSALGGISVLGPPARAEQNLTSVQGTTATAQLFMRGGIYNITSGAYKSKLLAVLEPIYSLYALQSGVMEVLGFPTSEEVVAPGGRRRQTFERGSIEYEQGAAPVIRWPVATITVAPSAVRMNLGETITVSATVLTSAGQQVSDRTIAWSTSNGRVIAVQGSGTTATLRAVGGGGAVITATAEGKSASVTVFVSAPCCQLGEGAPSPSVQQSFEEAVTRNRLSIRIPAPAPARRIGSGYVQEVWSADPGSSERYLIARSDRSSMAYVVTAAFLQRYLELGGPAGPLGYPASDGTPGGHQLFENGSALGGSPVRLVSGAILARWSALQYEAGAAGPVEGEAVSFLTFLGTAGRMQAFRNGLIVASETGPQAGKACLVRGPILARYSALGGPAGSLGAPLNEEFLTGGARRQDFEGGHIEYAEGASEATAHERERRPSVNASPNPVAAGSKVRITVSGFPNGSTLRVSMTGRPDFEVRAETGAYSWENVVPATAPSGTVAIRAVEIGSNASAEGSYRIRAAGEVKLTLSKISGDAQSGPPGAVLPQPLRVLLRDDAGSPVPGAPVRFTAFAASPGAEVFPSSAVTDENGTAEAALRLPMAEGITLVTAEGGRQVTTFSARVSASRLANFPGFLQEGDAPLGKGPGTIAQKGALLAATASIIRYHQDRRELPAPNGLADPALLNQFLASLCVFDGEGNQVCDGFLSAPESGEPIVNLWRLAAFVDGNLQVSVEKTDPAALRDLLAGGSPVLLALSLSADGVETGSHFVVAIGVLPNGEIQIHDPNAGFGQTVLSEYLAGFTAGSRAWKGILTAALRLIPAPAGATGFLISGPRIPFELESPAGPCGSAVEWPNRVAAPDQPPAPVSYFRALYCDGAQPLYQLDIAAEAEYELTLTDLGLMGSRSQLVGKGPAAYKLTRPSTRLVAGPLNPGLADNAVVNAASFTPAIAPGSLVSIFGTGLAKTGGRTQVKFGQVEGSVLAATPFQVNAHVPLDLAPGSHVLRIQTPYGNIERPIEIQATAPAIFLLDSTRGAVVNQDGSINSTAIPAQRGEVITIYCTGLGAVSMSGALQVASTPVTAILGERELPVAFAGLTPGFLGLYQVNVSLPPSIPPRLDGSLVLKQGVAASNRVPLAVQ